MWNEWMKPLKNGTQVLTEPENVKGTSHNLKRQKYIKPYIVLESNTFLRYSSKQDFDLYLLKWLAISSLWITQVIPPCNVLSSWMDG